MSRPRNSTNIEQLMDLSDIFESNKNSNSKMQSMEGYPSPPHVREDFSSQMNKENAERNNVSFKRNIRQSSNPRVALNGGNPDSSEFYPLSPYDNSNMNMSRVKDRQIDNYPIDDMDMDMDFDDIVPRYQGNRKREQNQYISCIDIARHIKSCPICSRFYDNDKSAYIIGIVFLLVICIILLKKIVEIIGNKD